MRKTFLQRLVDRRSSRENVAKDPVFTYVPPVVPECKRPVTLRAAVLSWEPHVLATGKVRGVKFSACVQRYTIDTYDEEDGYKATFDGERYMFSTNEMPTNFDQEVKVGSLLGFTVWGMSPSDAMGLEYGNVIVVDGVNCTTKGSNLYFNATLVVNVEPNKINFIDFLPQARYSTDNSMLSKMKLNPYYIQGCDEHSKNMPPYYFEDITMKIKADQPHFKPFIEFNFTMVDGEERIAIGTAVTPNLCEDYVKMNGIQGIMDDIIPFPEKWNFTLVGYLTSYVSFSNQRVFVTRGFFF